MGTHSRRALRPGRPEIVQLCCAGVVFYAKSSFSGHTFSRCPLLSPLGSLWVGLGGARGLFWEALGLSWRPFGTLLGLRGDPLGVFQPPVAPFGALLGYLGVPLGPQGHLGGAHGGQDLILG